MRIYIIFVAKFNLNFKKMIEVNISDSDMQLLKYERYNHPHPRVMLKMDVVYLKGLGFSNEHIRKITDVCGNTMREYWKQYNQGGIERLKEVNFYKPGSEMQEYCGSIKEYFEEHPPSSIAQACTIIEKMTGIKRGETQVRKFLKSMKFRYIKSCSVPAKEKKEKKKRTAGIFGKKPRTPIRRGKRRQAKSFFC
jgi:transposase